MTVRVITDSTADLTDHMRAAGDIQVVPLKVHWGDTTYVDGVDLTSDRFYEMLPKANVLPKTSQPTPAEFEAMYRQYAGEPDGIVSIHISRKLSGTIQSAEIAARAVADTVAVDVVDAGTASLALGLVAIAAARVAQAGGDRAAVKAEAERAAKAVQVVFIVDTLEYLQKGGRIGKAAAFVGTLLNVKPILTVKDGEVHPMERARSRSKAMDRMTAYLTAMPSPAQYAVMHATTPDDAARVREDLSQHLPGTDVLVSRFGPVIGTYLGPGALGAAVLLA